MERETRPDPLRLALDAITDAERAQATQATQAAQATQATQAAAGDRYAVLAQRAQLRTLYAIAEEVRLLRIELRGEVADGDE